MIRHRPASQRGHANHGWLDARHSFSFAGYHNPAHMGFRALRVMNDDRIAAGQGFGAHPHRDMEILTYILDGQLEHRDNLGNGAVIGPGEFQRITAGKGVVHSEFNPSSNETVHLYQVWIQPRAHGYEPGYEELRDARPAPDRLTLVASADGHDGSLTIQQDADVWLGKLAAGAEVTFPIGEGRGVWVQLVRGAATVGGVEGGEGDGFAIEGEASVHLRSGAEGAEVLLFDLP